MVTQMFPRGWDEERVKRLIEHDELLTDEEQVADVGKASERPESQYVCANREFHDLIGRSRERARTEGAISSEEMRARFE